MLMREVRDPVFITINTADFWKRLAAEKHFCVTCFPLSDDRVDEIADMLRRLFHFREFATNRARRGKVTLVSHNQVRYYQVGERRVTTLSWPKV